MIASVEDEIARSSIDPRYSAAISPSTTASGTAMAAAYPARKNVLNARSEISAEIGR